MPLLISLQITCILLASPTESSSEYGGCIKPGDPTKAFNLMASKYIITQYVASDSVMHSAIHQASQLGTVPTTRACQYKFVEMKKNPDQIPPTLLVAECDKSVGGHCDPRCKPIDYMVPVLRRRKHCKKAFGTRIWILRHVRITIGFEMN